jgi:hypothetical protein
MTSIADIAALRAAVAAQRDAMVGLAQELIALATENPPGNGYRQPAPWPAASRR